MADLKNFTLNATIDSQYDGNEHIQFIPGDSRQVTIRSPPPTLHLENINSTILGDSQTNCACSSNTSETASVLNRKVSNGPAAIHEQANKRTTVALTHLPRRPPVDIEFKNLTYSVFEDRLRGYKTILKCVQGKFKSGELTAIMGPSGAGKSTLMNVLAGYKTSCLSGSVLINGKERNLRRFRKMSCYIMQDDRLLPHLTVYEAMTVSANLKLGKDVSVAAKRIAIQEIIETMGLSEACNTQTHCLSGGQRKRLSIALELVNNPPVMFFDEPTSGLDSSSCFQCLSLLKSLSRGGRTIICTIHQPSARLFEMFDYLYILAEGQCIYQGNVGGLIPFLSSMCLHCPSYHNPADYVMEVACGEHGECLQKLVSAVNNGKCNNYQQQQGVLAAVHSASNDILKTQTVQEPTVQSKTPESADAVSASSKTTPPETNGTNVVSVPVSCTTSLLDSAESIEAKVGFPTSGWIQFWILLKRTFLSQTRDLTLTRLRLVSHIVVGFLIGTIYYGIGNDASKTMSNAGCVFFTVMFVMFTAMMPTILTFPMEMAVFAREHLNYWYSLKSYYFARTLTDIPFQIVYTIAYVMIVYFMTAQPLECKRFFMFLNICILTSLVAQSIGLLIGAAMSVETGVFIGPVTSVPIILFSGFFVNFNVIPSYLRIFCYISYMRYSFEGAMVTIFGFDRRSLMCPEDFCLYKSPRKFLMDLSMDKADYWVDALALVGFLVGLRVVAYFVLRLKLHLLR